MYIFAKVRARSSVQVTSFFGLRALGLRVLGVLALGILALGLRALGILVLGLFVLGILVLGHVQRVLAFGFVVLGAISYQIIYYSMIILI